MKTTDLSFENLTAGPLPQRHIATHPEAFALGGRDLVADALCGDLALELGKREQDGERQAAHAGCCIEGLSDRYKGRFRLIQPINQLGKVSQ